MCMARLNGACLPRVNDSGSDFACAAAGRDLRAHPASNYIIDESTMVSQAAKEKILADAALNNTRVIFVGDFDSNGMPVQLGPIKQETMNLEGLHVFNVVGVQRTSDPALLQLLGTLRSIISSFPTAGDITASIASIIDYFREHNPSNIVAYQTAFRMFNAVNGDRVLCSCKRCPHCRQELFERCTCATATTIDEINFVASKPKSKAATKHSKAATTEDDATIDDEEDLCGDARAVYTALHGDSTLAANTSQSQAIMWTRDIMENSSCNEVTWRATESIKGTDLVNGSVFTSTAPPVYNGKNLEDHLKAGRITRSPTSTVHAYQGLTLDAPARLFIDTRYAWDIRLLYVMLSRVREASQLYFVDFAEDNFLQHKQKGEGFHHHNAKQLYARKWQSEINEHGDETNAVRTEYPFSGCKETHFIADVALLENGKPVAVAEIVYSSPPDDDKLDFYKSRGVTCFVVYLDKHGRVVKEDAIDP